LRARLKPFARNDLVIDFEASLGCAHATTAYTGRARQGALNCVCVLTMWRIKMPPKIVLLLTRLCKFLNKQSNQASCHLSTLLQLLPLATLYFVAVDLRIQFALFSSQPHKNSAQPKRKCCFFTRLGSQIGQYLHVCASRILRTL
jgi:hypothetical protein